MCVSNTLTDKFGFTKTIKLSLLNIKIKKKNNVKKKMPQLMTMPGHLRRDNLYFNLTFFSEEHSL